MPPPGMIGFQCSAQPSRCQARISKIVDHRRMGEQSAASLQTSPRPCRGFGPTARAMAAAPSIFKMASCTWSQMHFSSTALAARGGLSAVRSQFFISQALGSTGISQMVWAGGLLRCETPTRPCTTSLPSGTWRRQEAAQCYSGRGRTLLQSKDGRADSADQGKRDGRRNARLGTQEREERYATCARQARTSRHLEQGAARPARLILNRLLPARCAVAGLGFRGLRMDRARRVRLEP